MSSVLAVARRGPVARGTIDAVLCSGLGTLGGPQDRLTTWILEQDNDKIHSLILTQEYFLSPLIHSMYISYRPSSELIIL